MHRRALWSLLLLSPAMSSLAARADAVPEPAGTIALVGARYHAAEGAPSSAP